MDVNEEYYDNYRMLFNEPGWKQFKEDMTETLRLVKENMEKVKTTQELYYHKGVIANLTSIANFEKNFRTLEEKMNDL